MAETSGLDQIVRLGELHDKSVARSWSLTKKNLERMDMIKRFAYKQRHVWCPCPRCGMDRMYKDAAKNALSRRADIMVCDICGSAEAIEDIPGNVRIPLEDWALFEHPEKFFLRGKDYESFWFVFTEDEAYPFRNAYMVVEAFDYTDAAGKIIARYGKKGVEELPYACFYSRNAWDGTPELHEKYRYVGTLHLNGCFEPAE